VVDRVRNGGRNAGDADLADAVRTERSMRIRDARLFVWQVKR
jgi:hypothetical protein